MHLKEVVYTKYPDELLNNQDDPKGNHNNTTLRTETSK
jgi:hypothetical protein